MKKDIITYHRYRNSHGRSWRDSMQTAISAKIDDDVMEMVDAECHCSGIKRNRLINLALRWYIEELDEARRDVCNEKKNEKYILNVDISDLTTGELEMLDHICRGFGCEKEVIVKHLVRMMLHDYDKNPYKYMP